ncbi:unnamed protein product [Adineta steineri]|uniref:Uncharacterized protein n=1 Tax=Adineta steineri TaxID=433720 RepID=A0A819IFX4_9BILA|nr:unnamed protein product [Adineta steineri]CAF3913228.1 unnamed protein product [Adineta steineri]
MADNNITGDTNDDGNILFDFSTYEEFRTERLKINYENTLKLWYSLPSGLPTVDNRRVRRYSHREQRARKKKVMRFCAYYVLLKRTPYKKKVYAKGSQLWHDSLNLPSLRDGSIFDIYQSFNRLMNEFFDKAENYDSAVNKDELFKASRLVWYMFAFELQLNLPVVLTDSMFGYNMLYPYTDDLVDSNDISREAKKDFAHIFHERLLIGESNYNSKSHFNGVRTNVDQLQLSPSLKPFADRIGKIFDMVKFIENDWKRDDEHRGVYMSLATIHECQTKSTLQHARPDDNYAPTMATVEQISAEKGGASIIATGFLIEGRLTRAKMAYLEYLGFALQLLDDLQDVTEDLKNNHRTIFTQSIVEGQTLDATTARLIQFFNNLPPSVKFSEIDTVSNKQNDLPMLEYIHTSMVMFMVVLVIEAAAQLQRYYSDEFYRELSARSPIRLKNHNKVRIEKRILSVVRRQWF